jgi:glycosyltransferase
MIKRNPKVSIITVVKNGMPHLIDAVNSFLKQDYQNKELIIIYSKSSDFTLKYIKKIKNNNKNIKLFIDKYSTNKFGSLNLAIKKADGQLLGLLHADDIFFSNDTIKSVVNSYKTFFFDICYGDIIISKRNNLFSIVRLWKSINFYKNKLHYGWMPPHTSIFLSRNVYKKFYYNTSFSISSDYDYIFRIFNYSKKIIYLDKIITVMREGGDSSKNLTNIFIKIKEDFKIICNYYSYKRVFIILFLKSFTKISQYFFIYKFRFNDYLKSFVKKIDIKVLKKISSSMFKKNFLIIGLNLACFSYILVKHNKFINNKYTFFWPDGIFSKIFIQGNIIPGRNFIKNIKVNNNIDNIYLLGSKNNEKLKYLKKKFLNKRVIFYEIPRSNLDIIFKSLKKLKFKKNNLIFINLPTPKQELIAFFITQNIKNFKIICSGGAIDYNAGLQALPPKFFIKYRLESLWRLRYDFFRRLNRFLVTIIVFFKNYLLKNYDQYSFKKI